MTNSNSGRWGGRASERAGARDMAMDADTPEVARLRNQYREIYSKLERLNRPNGPRGRTAHPDDPNWKELERLSRELDRIQDQIQDLTSRARDSSIAMDPLTSKGEEIKSAMEKEYGPKKGESVFYASANKGTIKGVHDARWSGRAKDGYDRGKRVI